METAHYLSPQVQTRFVTYVENLGGFHWGDPERATPLIRTMCGHFVQEAELLIQGIRANVADKLYYSTAVSPTAAIMEVAEEFAQIASVPVPEARWVTISIAAALGYVRLPKAGEMLQHQSVPDPSSAWHRDHSKI